MGPAHVTKWSNSKVHFLALSEWPHGLHQWIELVQVSIHDLNMWRFSHLMTVCHHMWELSCIDTWSGSGHRLRWNVDESTEKTKKWTSDVILSQKASSRAVSCSLTWSHRANCRSFQREVPVVRSIFMLPRNCTLLALCVLQFASCKHTTEHGLNKASGALNIWYKQHGALQL